MNYDKKEPSAADNALEEPAVAYYPGRRAIAEPWAGSRKDETAALSMVQDKYAILEKSFGMFSDGRLSSERFMAEKRIEKELEDSKENQAELLRRVLDAKNGINLTPHELIEIEDD